MVLESHKDPVVTDPDCYRILFENARVRVLEYTDTPGTCTKLHEHPDSVMVTLSSFRRRVSSGGRSVEVDVPVHQARWVAAQEHVGENIGSSDTHSVFVELKEPSPAPAAPADPPLGPSAS
jgi:hypothetical protein